VLAAHGYPGTPRLGDPIEGANTTFDVDTKLFHAGTRQEGGRLLTSGGRVLTLCALGDDLRDAQQRAYAAVEHVRFDGMQLRRDIGRRGLMPRD